MYGLVDTMASGGTDLMFLEGDPIKVTAILGNDQFMVRGARRTALGAKTSWAGRGEGRSSRAGWGGTMQGRIGGAERGTDW